MAWLIWFSCYVALGYGIAFIGRVKFRQEPLMFVSCVICWPFLILVMLIDAWLDS